MRKIERDQSKKYAFDWRDDPLITVEPGESFIIETLDAGAGYFKSESDLAIPGKRPGFDRWPPLANPIGGPVFVRGAEPGDTLVVCIESIEVDSYSWTAVGPNRGPLGDSVRWNEVSKEYTTMVFDHRPGPDGSMQGGTLPFNAKISWPITPFVGTLGVAPDREVCTSLDGQGPWGGNLDVRDFAVGNRISIPLFHTGGLFYLGDVHASQGDTEFSGTAAETKATVRLRLELTKGERRPWIRIDKPENTIALAIARPLELAVDLATQQMMELLLEAGFTQSESYCLVSTCPDFRVHIYQMCKIGKLSYVAGTALPNHYLLSGS